MEKKHEIWKRLFCWRLGNRGPAGKGNYARLRSSTSRRPSLNKRKKRAYISLFFFFSFFWTCHIYGHLAVSFTFKEADANELNFENVERPLNEIVMLNGLKWRRIETMRTCRGNRAMWRRRGPSTEPWEWPWPATPAVNHQWKKKKLGEGNKKRKKEPWQQHWQKKRKKERKKRRASGQNWRWSSPWIEWCLPFSFLLAPLI